MASGTTASTRVLAIPEPARPARTLLVTRLGIVERGRRPSPYLEFVLVTGAACVAVLTRLLSLARRCIGEQRLRTVSVWGLVRFRHET